MASPDLLQIFLAESEELLAELEGGLVRLEVTPGDRELLNAIFRAAHTIKGNAGIVGLDELVDFAHGLETVLDRLREGVLKPGADTVSVLLASVDVLRAMQTQVETGGQITGVERAVEVSSALLRLCDPAALASVPPAPEQRFFRVQMSFRPDLFATGQDPLLLVEEVLELGTALKMRADSSSLPTLADMDVHTCYLSWDIILETEVQEGEIRNIFLFVSDENQIQIDLLGADAVEQHLLPDPDARLGEILVDDGKVSPAVLAQALESQKPVGKLLVEAGAISPQDLETALSKQEQSRSLKRVGSIRVDTDKLDRLVNLVGELVISAANTVQAARDESANMEARRATAETLERITRELQEQVLTVRMVPVEDTFKRFDRVVRDLARELGKKVRLATSGTETELDKTVVERLVDPLKHMVRNCVDHGIESPQERVLKGKPEEATVELRARQREGRIVIEIADDGRGISSEAVLKRARERGLIGETETLTEARTFDLIFQPGFSTAAQVTEISGRGVGLDVVRRNVEELSGTVEVESQAGLGTTFRIQLPLTLAIIDGMTVRVGNERLTIPLLSVVELVDPAHEEIKLLEGNRALIRVRGEYIPMIKPSEFFGIQADEGRQQNVVVIDCEGARFGVLVDQVLGMDQAVVKSLDPSFHLFRRLGTHLERPVGVAGATILSDGTVSIIVDVHGLRRFAFGEKI